MIKQKVIYGGNLERGDFLIVSGVNYLQFGWYIGPGKNTIQFFNMRSINITKTNFYNWKNNKKLYWGSKFLESGLTLSNFHKDRVLNHHSHKIMKFTGDPETIFTEQEHLIEYRTAKALLEKLNFLI